MGGGIELVALALFWIEELPPPPPFCVFLVLRPRRACRPQRPEKVTNYAWANEKAKVKIYVPVEGCSAIDDAHISLVRISHSPGVPGRLLTVELQVHEYEVTSLIKPPGSRSGER